MIEGGTKERNKERDKREGQKRGETEEGGMKTKLMSKYCMATE